MMSVFSEILNLLNARAAATKTNELEHCANDLPKSTTLPKPRVVTTPINSKSNSFRSVLDLAGTDSTDNGTFYLASLMQMP